LAWTAPASYAVSDVLTAANLNTYLRDNMNYLKGNAGAVVISDEIQSVVAAGGSLLAQGTSNPSFARYKMLCLQGGVPVDWRFLANGINLSEFAIYEATTERLRIAQGGNVMIGAGAPQGALHVIGRTTGGVAQGGHLVLQATAVTTLQTIAAAGTVPRAAGFLIIDRNNTGGAIGAPNYTAAAVGTNFTYTNTDTITVAVTAGGAITVQRTVGTNGSHDISLFVVLL